MTVALEVDPAVDPAHKVRGEVGYRDGVVRAKPVVYGCWLVFVDDVEGRRFQLLGIRNRGPISDRPPNDIRRRLDVSVAVVSLDIAGQVFRSVGEPDVPLGK